MNKRKEIKQEARKAPESLLERIKRIEAIRDGYPEDHPQIKVIDAQIQGLKARA